MNKKEKTPFDRLPLSEQVSETFYFRALELTKCAFHAINRAFPLDARKANPRTDLKYNEAHSQAKQHLNQYKTLVRDYLVPLGKYTRHKAAYDFTEDNCTKQFRGGILVQFTALKERLVDYADLLVPAEDVASFTASLEKVFEREKTKLFDGEPGVGLSNYEVNPVITEQDI